MRFVLCITGAKGALHDVKASNAPEVLEDEDEEVDFFGKDEMPTTQPEHVKKPRPVGKALEEEEDEEDEEELFDPLGSVR